MNRNAGHSETTRKWKALVAQGGIRNALTQGQDVTIRGRVIPAGTPVEVWLELLDGDPKPFARVVAGDPLDVTMTPRPIGDFNIVLCPHRKLRPGVPKAPPVGRQPDFVTPGEDGCKFECKRVLTPMSLLLRAPLMEVTLPHGSYAVLPNAAFFEPRGHVLLVPIEGTGGERRYPHRPQQLTLAYLEDLLQFQELNHDQLGFYNSIHAGAAVDHIHIQFAYHGERLAIEQAPTTRFRGIATLGEAYHARGLVFARNEAPETVHTHVERCQDRGIPFNLIATSEKIFLIPRDRDHEVLAQFPTGVLASMEMAGKAITDDETIFKTLALEEIAEALDLATFEDLRVIIE